MKIKRKVQLTLPQLIEWGFGNDIREKSFIANEYVGDQKQEVHFNAVGIPKFSAFVNKDSTFTIEVEEEITEDTVIPKMLVIGRFDGYEEVYNQKLSSFNQHLLSAYLIHDDGHMELIYDEVKGLVE